LPLPWFRRKKELAPHAAAASTASPESPAADAAPAAGGTSSESTSAATTAKRRRGTRGGRNRKKKTATVVSTTDAPAAKTPAARTRAPQSSRRRQPPKRAPLPKAKRELLISVDPGEKRVAVLEDDRVAEVYLERPERRSIAGNIYLGTVDNVLPGMEAAFVEIGLEKNGFLYVDEIVTPELEGKRHGKKIQDLISRGDTLMVQAVKDPM
jgi:ribonuclease G